MAPEVASTPPSDESTDATAQLRPGVIEPGIPAALAREPMYGWRLAERLTELGLIAGIGTLYPVLGRMRDRGAIEAFERPPVTGPARKYYDPTPAGAAELRAFRTQWRQFAGTVAAHLGEQRGIPRTAPLPALIHPSQPTRPSYTPYPSICRKKKITH